MADRPDVRITREREDTIEFQAKHGTDRRLMERFFGGEHPSELYKKVVAQQEAEFLASKIKSA